MVTPSIEPAERSRLLPRSTLSAVLVLLTLFGLLAWLARLAWMGMIIPQAILLTLSGLLVFQLFSMIFFWIAWFPAYVVKGDEDDALRGSPFAADQLPPQILPPRENTP